MSISIKTHKMLWGRAASRCAICKTDLALDKTEVDDESLVGDECHIVARQDGGPRGDESWQTDQRDKYSNLILLCKNHHKQVDDQRNYYTVDRLQEIKAAHEIWVRENLGNYDKARQRDDEIYATYIDDWEHKTSLSQWQDWTSGLLTPQPYLVNAVGDELQELPRWLLSRVWPKRYEGLEGAFVNFRLVLSDLLRIFFRHSEQDSWQYETVKFYKGQGGWNEYYNQDLQRYEHHVDLIHDLTFELTRSANYVCDQIRQHVSPTYRIDSGRLLVSRADIRGYTYCTEYQGVERTATPYAGLEKFMIERANRDFWFGEGSEPQFHDPLEE